MLRLRGLGPGIVIAATGLGAGDLIAASVAGANYGIALLWAAMVGALLKFTLNEGLARWQLATGTTLLEGWGAVFSSMLGVWQGVPYLFADFVREWRRMDGEKVIDTGSAATPRLNFCLPNSGWRARTGRSRGSCR